MGRKLLAIIVQRHIVPVTTERDIGAVAIHEGAGQDVNMVDGHPLSAVDRGRIPMVEMIEYFEAGGGQITLERLHSFARAVRADPNGLVAAIMIGSPEFALRSADNKLVAAFLITLQEFDAAGGDDLKRIDTTTYLNAFSETFERLLDEARRKAELERMTLERMGNETLSEPPEED